MRPLYECRERAGELTILGCDTDGNISYKEMEDAIRRETKAVVCTHASDEPLIDDFYKREFFIVVFD